MSQKRTSAAKFDCGMSRLTWRNSATFQDYSAARNAAYRLNPRNPSASSVRRTCTAVGAGDFSSEFRFRVSRCRAGSARPYNNRQWIKQWMAVDSGEGEGCCVVCRSDAVERIQYILRVRISKCYVGNYCWLDDIGPDSSDSRWNGADV